MVSQLSFTSTMDPSVTIQDLQCCKVNNNEPSAIMKQCQMKLMKGQSKNIPKYIYLEKQYQAPLDICFTVPHKGNLILSREVAPGSLLLDSHVNSKVPYQHFLFASEDNFQNRFYAPCEMHRHGVQQFRILLYTVFPCTTWQGIS